ncbi:DUF6519 domain-containing protein [Streptomyces sp. NBC_00237]|uniref:DUF6519 domain-containing protein n=1 Tax=Streptomyces sp. NBC_00237 TaxID=2975687 RepID=UPI002250395B|nr:DUF6519 domain-containing protein [Streptomyces sp. NBC_00237]MCX5205366.1 DUF6519 domain-containing protein [Streptomyces sp. NBC_00237]
MAGDYSQTGFDAFKHFSGVLMQQGRVQLDRDWNEQSLIVRHLLRSLARDLIGPHGGPGTGFAVDVARDKNDDPLPLDFTIAPGHYYVDGILCENEGPRPPEPLPCRYSTQPDLTTPAGLQANHSYLVHLDVWEREVVALQDHDLRDVALGGADTTARSRVVWQVRALDVTGDAEFPKKSAEDYLNGKRPGLSTGRLHATALQEMVSQDPCTVSPDARYRGPENQLYRVEIHRPGTAYPAGTATFKWSRDNAAAVLAVVRTADRTVTVESLGRDDRLSVTVGDWVELLDDDAVLRRASEPLLRVEDVDPVDLRVVLGASPSPLTLTRHPLLLRWDHRKASGVELSDGAVPLREDTWLDLEDGVRIRFEAGGTYRTGDHWLIPARTATGDVIWPGPPDAPAWQPPQGTRHHYAPLQLIALDGNGQLDPNRGTSYRRTIAPAAKA